MKTRRRFFAVQLAVVLGALLVGCTSDDDFDSDAERSHRSSTTSEQHDGSASGSSDSPSGGDVITAQRAGEIALEEASDGAVVVEIDEHSSSRVAQWEVVVLNSDGTGTEFRIDMATGEVLSSAPEGLDAEARTAPKVTAARAMEIALSTTPGEVIELGLDVEGRKVVWDVEVRSTNDGNHELTIDASSGEVLEHERS